MPAPEHGGIDARPAPRQGRTRSGRRRSGCWGCRCGSGAGTTPGGGGRSASTRQDIGRRPRDAGRPAIRPAASRPTTRIAGRAPLGAAPSSSGATPARAGRRRPAGSAKAPARAPWRRRRVDEPAVEQDRRRRVRRPAGTGAISAPADLRRRAGRSDRPTGGRGSASAAVALHPGEVDVRARRRRGASTAADRAAAGACWSAAIRASRSSFQCRRWSCQTPRPTQDRAGDGRGEGEADGKAPSRRQTSSCAGFGGPVAELGGDHQRP